MSIGVRPAPHIYFLTLAERLISFVNARFDGNRASFARAVGMSPQVLNDYLSGRREKPGAEVLLKWKKVGLNINWLLDGVGEMLIEEEIKAAVVKENLAAYGIVDELTEHDRMLAEYIAKAVIRELRKNP